MPDYPARQYQVWAAAMKSTPAEPFFRLFARGGCADLTFVSPAEGYPWPQALTRCQGYAAGYDLGAGDCQ